MDGFVSVVTALAMICFSLSFLLVPAALIGLVVWLVRRNMRRADLFAQAAGPLGLSPEGQRRLVGVRSGVHVRLRHVHEGSSDNRSSWTYVEATIDPPLRLGARINAQGWLGAAFSELVGKDISVGDPSFDRDFSVGAIEEDEIARFLNPEFRRDLSGIRARYPSLWVTDDEVLLKFSGWVTDAHRLGLALDAAVGLSSGALAARRAMGPTARERAVIDSWSRVAMESGWAFDREQLALTGAVDRASFQVVPVLNRSGWSTRFRVSFDRPLGVDLQLRKQGAFSAVGRFFGVQDIVIGDPRFDDSFTVKGSNPDGVRRVLDDEALRGQLLTLLAAAKSFEVGDNHVEALAHGLVDQAPSLRHSLDLVAEVARGLRARVDAPAVGAYR
ncbi:MAG: hypothetical protein JRH11_13305 [Deltaproteobacteria bacterium]|nr:hypothetical protein [Deltaproteobacteria bacterium]